MKRPMGLLLLIVVITATVELCVIARWLTGVFDPRCLVLRGYVLAHSYTTGQEVIRCVHDTP